ncbi:MAG: 4-hydroxy-tetrahydrodipicolinate synthase [Euryarchaeota archaeon]|nr:4-hydroxy-tetrahydrodipicolinate synthase [Euryarchaeota archaeon]MCG2736964.1 4-hydroxy-tetrahydrodipicolinate synthase [Candidatus Methanoperedenaceae archaeon]MDP3105382.1 4-hydroxy-tetrahydrodipicolinate synthase [Candidatus Methanoperedens sp.]MBU4221241.1 4-hydroxy-tetrahydrodipicolinate synthase [Euryarchaeota archaeon]MBU4339510.1 4-hydroxy-tetrahydrodipicolinate synthase [Euryarchaeota archaeon]
MIEGVLPALITPFTKDNRVDKDGIRQNIEFLIDGGVSGVVPCGTTGEAATLSLQEHEKVIEYAIEYSSVPVVAGTGSNNTTEALELTRFAHDAGADAALLITPYYNKPNDSGMLKHFKTIAEAVDIPIIIYNVPSRTGINLKPELTAELAKVSNIVGIKEASGNLDQITRIIELTKDEDFTVLSGDDGLTLPILSIGGSGVISVVANVAPKLVVSMVEAFRSGDLERARELHLALAPLIRAMFLETNPVPVKKAVELIGLPAGNLRLPLAPISPDNEKKLKIALKDLHLIE